MFYLLEYQNTQLQEKITGVFGSRVVGIAGCSSVLQIPQLFLEGLSDPVVMLMLVSSLLISLQDAILLCWIAS